MRSIKTVFFALVASLQLGLSAEEIPEIDWKALGETKPWLNSEQYKEIPIVTPGSPGEPPSDAVILFDGKDLSAWESTPLGEGVRMDRTEWRLNKHLEESNPGPAQWTVTDGVFVAKKETGSIATKQRFGDMQMHIEWMVPVMEDKEGQKYGNSGFFIMGLYEIQILNSYENDTYSNGQAASVYKQRIPLVNASKEPGTWQSFDLVFTAPRFSDEDGKLIHPAYLTLLHNGVLAQLNVPLEGPTAFIGKPYYIPHPDKLPIVLQDHGNPVHFRNIWVREL